MENQLLFFEKLDFLLNTVGKMGVNTVLVADFNVNFNSHDLEFNELCSIIKSYGLNIVLRNVITRPGLRGEGTCIDNMVTSFAFSKCKAIQFNS